MSNFKRDILSLTKACEHDIKKLISSYKCYNNRNVMVNLIEDEMVVHSFSAQGNPLGGMIHLHFIIRQTMALSSATQYYNISKTLGFS